MARLQNNFTELFLLCPFYQKLLEWFRLAEEYSRRQR